LGKKSNSITLPLLALKRRDRPATSLVTLLGMIVNNNIYSTAHGVGVGSNCVNDDAGFPHFQRFLHVQTD
jgi:xanthosine utilization system XapX-like protein